jgi:hypothetical protein
MDCDSVAITQQRTGPSRCHAIVDEDRPSRADLSLGGSEVCGSDRRHWRDEASDVHCAIPRVKEDVLGLEMGDPIAHERGTARNASICSTRTWRARDDTHRPDGRVARRAVAADFERLLEVYEGCALMDATSIAPSAWVSNLDRSKLVENRVESSMIR